MTSPRQMANAIRALSMDAVQQANSGHPGAPMGMADIAQVLWTRYLKHNPGNPQWFNRDRFILSNGHGSMLLYALLHLTGYGLPIEEIKRFRQLHSRTPGHPEYGYTPGVETTTGPLGQGLANAVGFALAEKMLASQFNREKSGAPYDIVDHRTWVFVGDGCLMEGVSHEAASLAGTLALGKLTCIYDDNGISIDGEVKGWFTDDTPKRFEAYGWHVVPNVDGHDAAAVAAAIESAIAETGRPTLICCKTRIGYGSPNKAGKASSHGSPLGADEISATRAALGWNHEPFVVPAELYEAWDYKRQGAEAENRWQQQLAEYSAAFPDLASELDRRIAGRLPDNWAEAMEGVLRQVNEDGKTQASRVASGATIAQIAQLLPELVGGSADLSGSNCTTWDSAKAVTAKDASGNYIYYGVREFGMTAVANGIGLHGGLRPFTGTFLMFMEYARNAVRMCALMGVPQILVYTHDSIGQGEDGPTHQPVEQLTNLRTTPGLSVWRPCDGVETVVAWRAAIERLSGPTALVFSRQNLVHQVRDESQVKGIARGGYILREPGVPPKAVIIATGSEVAIASQAFELLAEQNIPVRVVSMPSTDVFDAQAEDYQEQVLPRSLPKRLAVEAAHPDYWRKYVGLEGQVLGLPCFGESGPGSEVMAHFGFTPESIVGKVREMLESK